MANWDNYWMEELIVDKQNNGFHLLTLKLLKKYKT